jgi:hypothetical protein
MAANFKGIARDSQGNTLDSADVQVYETGTTTEVSIYEEESLTTLISQPLVTSANGAYNFWAAYDDIDVVISKTGYSTYTVSNVQLGNACDLNYIIDTIEAETHSGIIRIISGVTTADLDTASGWVLLDESSWADGHLKDFDTPAQGRLRYTGTNTKEFLVQCNMSLDTAIANIDYDVGIGLNGADPAQWMTKTSRGVANDIIVISSMAHVELDQNEYIEVFARGSNAGADVVTILHGQLSARNISFKALP